MDGAVELARARDCHARGAWVDAYGALSAVDQRSGLEPTDIESLATAAFMIGREGEYLALIERAHAAYLDTGATERAVRCAFWLGVNLARRGEFSRGGGWLARARRLLEREADDSVEHGYLLLPLTFEFEASGELERAAETAAAAAAIGDRLGDSDLFALAAHEQGRVLIRGGRLRDGLALLDEAMVAVTGGELSPIVAGIVYCGVILACQEAHDVRRAQEWTAALSNWCERQQDLVAFTGRCLVHRAELMQLHGEWREALEEAEQARLRCDDSENAPAAGEAYYRQGEIHRLRGAFEPAESAYEDAGRNGREPQPGLALLRLAQGRPQVAAVAIRRVLAETVAPGRRIAHLPAAVEILLAADAPDDARAACAELDRLAADRPGGSLAAMAAFARGALELAGSDAGAALVTLRRALGLWLELDVPHEAARTRVLVAAACEALRDAEGADLQLRIACEAFVTLGAAPDLARLEQSGGRDPRTGDLTARELEVVRLVAAGSSNRRIAEALTISEHTVARHLQNIYAKLGVSSRTAATAYAFKHDIA